MKRVKKIEEFIYEKKNPFHLSSRIRLLESKVIDCVPYGAVKTMLVAALVIVVSGLYAFRCDPHGLTPGNTGAEVLFAAAKRQRTRTFRIVDT